MPDEYIKRIIDSYIKEYLDLMGALSIEGPKWCGKTRTSEEFAGSILCIDNKDQIDSLKLAARSGVRAFLEGDTPRLIDEWQEVPEIWDAVRFEVDRRRKKGQFILTGSSAPPEGSVMHSGAGRIARVTMRPMSLFESGESNGQVSLEGLFDSDRTIDGYSELKVDALAYAITRGGWPESVGEPRDRAPKIATQYIKALINSDFSRFDLVKWDPNIVKRVIESISRNISTSASREAIRRDVNGAKGTVAESTIAAYINTMEKVFLLDNLPAWNPHMRSRTRLMRTPKWHFADPSIAAASLRASADALLADYKSFGLLFESMCIRDLRVYADPLDGRISYFRDNNGNEVDAIVELPGGKWGAVEIKLGGDRIDEGAKNLLKLERNIDTEYMKQPSFLMVLTADRYAYRRPDGVLVVPVGCLRN
ncbi:MAG: DUF4143 domain-containing protein [Candidatus Methanoplasma sp.]|nr:DUF4143 domain-containing protein [Candidatus Methanoplasma sp.]